MMNIVCFAVTLFVYNNDEYCLFCGCFYLCIIMMNIVCFAVAFIYLCDVGLFPINDMQTPLPPPPHIRNGLIYMKVGQCAETNERSNYISDTLANWLSGITG